MNRDEIKRLIDDLDDDAQIIVINTKDEAKAVPRALIRDCQRISVKDRVLFLWRKTRAGAIATVWSVALALFPEVVPTPIKIVTFSYDQIEPLVAEIDWSFPHVENHARFPDIAYERVVSFGSNSLSEKATYVLPSSGFDGSSITANTGIYPV